MEVVKNLFLFRWYSGPSQAQGLEEASVSRVPQIEARKMEFQFLEKEISLPEEFKFGASRPVFSVLCEDAIMFYTVRRCSHISDCLDLII